MMLSRERRTAVKSWAVSRAVESSSSSSIPPQVSIIRSLPNESTVEISRQILSMLSWTVRCNASTSAVGLGPIQRCNKEMDKRIMGSIRELLVECDLRWCTIRLP